MSLDATEGTEVEALRSDLASARRHGEALQARIDQLEEAASVIPGRHPAEPRDVTDRVAAEDALRRSEAVFRAVIEKSNEVISLTAADGTTRYLTPSAWSMLGWAPDEIGGRTLRDQVVAEDRARLASALAHMVRSGSRDLSMELRVHHRDGTIRWVESTGTNLLDDPDVCAIVGNYRDITERKRADEALRASRTELEEAQAISLVGSWTSGFLPDGVIQWSREAARILGVPADAPMAVKDFFAVVHPDDRDRFFRASFAAIRLGARADVEHRIQRPDGGVRWVHQRGVVERDASGQPVRFVGTFQDITERRQTEDLLKASEQRLALATRSAELGIWEWDLQRNMLVWEPQMYALYGVRQEDFSGAAEAWESGLHRDDREAARAEVEAAVRGTKEFHTEFRVVWPSGEVRFLEAHGVVVCAADGSPVRVIGINRDITERKRADEALRASEESLRSQVGFLRIAAKVARIGGWSVSLGDSRVTWSDEVCAIHGVPPGTVAGLGDATDNCVPEFREIMRQSFEACARDGTSFDLELQVVTATGRRLWVRRMGDAVRDESGKVIAVRGAVQDIDDRRKLEDQFRQAQRMEAVGRLAGGVAHDFNNLLTVILSYVQLAIEGLKDGDPLRDDMQQVEEAAKRASELTRQLLAFSRQQVMQPRVLELNEVLLPMERMLVRLLGEDIALALLTAPGLGRVVADPSQLEQVVMNLAVNARDAMPEGGSLTFETSEVHFGETYVGGLSGIAPGDYALLAVTDTGDGMDAETSARIFEPFFTTKAPGKGTGLGLSTVFGIVRQSGGYVGVYSELGVGTTFKIYLPLTDRPADVKGPERARAVARGSETVLLVEDDDQVRAIACTILRRNGYTVLEASNGGEAFLVSRSFAATIHLLLTDVVMPRMSGRRLAEELAPLRPAMRVLYASGYTDDAILHHGVLDAGVAFIQKPFTPDALLRRVRQVLDTPVQVAS